MTHYRKQIILAVVWGVGAVLLNIVGNPVRAYADTNRRCAGPYTLSANGSVPSASGAEVKDFDTDMSVHLWKTGPDAITVDVEGTLFSTAEDASNGSFKSLAQKTTSEVLSIKGPLTRLRFTASGCGVNCTTKAVVCGRISQ